MIELTAASDAWHDADIVTLLRRTVAHTLTKGESTADAVLGAWHLGKLRAHLANRDFEPREDPVAVLQLFCWWPLKPPLEPSLRAQIRGVRRHLFEGVSRSERVLRELIEAVRPEALTSSPLELLQRMSVLGRPDLHWLAEPSSASSLAERRIDIDHHSDTVFLPGNWSAATRDVARSLFFEFNPLDDIRTLRADTTRIEAIPLPWYEGVDLLKLSDPQWDASGFHAYFLHEAGSVPEFIRCDGTSATASPHGLAHRLRLSADNVLSYLKFFSWSVRADEGPFVILDGKVLGGLVEAGVRTNGDTAAAEIPQPRLVADDANGRFRCEATMLYGERVFASSLVVNTRGEVMMESDSPLALSLPVRFVSPAP